MIPYRSLLLSLGGMLFATIQVFNYSFMSCHISQLYNVVDVQASSRAAQAVAGVPDVRQKAAAAAAAPVELTVDEREERDRRLAMTESDSDLSALSEGAFGGCLMIMDDNHFLVEWLAYHYHTLPLRHLFVLVDDKSQTSPLSILERWQDKMTIEVVDWKWPGVLIPVPEGDYLENQTEIRHYIGRQNMFLQQCMQTYKRRNWNSWIIMTDTDEFVGNNRWQHGKAHPLFDGVIPSANETGSVMRRLEQVAGDDTCIMTNRTHSCEETKPISSTYSSELGFSDHDFLTFEWNLGHTLKNPKAMMDIGRIPADYLEKMDLLNEGTVHDILPGRGCPDRPYFRMYHYPGSEEQRTFRDSVDPRGPAATRIGGSRPLIQRKCSPMPTIHMHPWLDGFVKNVHGGADEAKRLLDGVGKTGPWPKYQGRIM